MSEARKRESPVLADRLAVPLLFFLLTLVVVLGLSKDESFFLRGDSRNCTFGGYTEIARALDAGELPLLTLTSWQAGALAGEFQYGAFSPVLAVLNVLLFRLDLSVQYNAAALVWIHLLILSGGAYLLARSRNLSQELSLMVALVSSLNGWMMIFGVNWFVALASFAWLPWSWWAIERAIRRGGELRNVVAAGLFIALLITAGFPFTCLMIFGVAAGSAGRLMHAKRPLVETLPAMWSLLIGLGLSAPAWLMLVEYSGSTLRSQMTHPLIFQTDFMVPFKAWFATILPTLKAAWNAPWQAPWPPPGDTWSLVMHAGLAPVVILVAAGIVLRSKLVRKLEYDFLLLLIVFLLLTLPSLGVLRWSFRWLPLFFLQLSLIAGSAAMMLRATEPRRLRYGKVAWFLAAAVSGYAAIVDGDHGMEYLRFSTGLLAVASLWWGLESIRRLDKLHRQLPWIVASVSSLLIIGLALRNFPYQQRRVEPRATPAFDQSVTYLALYTMEDSYGRLLRFPGQRYFPGNEHMHSGLRFVNGGSPLGPDGTTWTFGFNYLGALPAKLSPANDSRPLGPLLRRMAVDGLVLWPDSRELRNIPFEEFEKHASLLPGIDVYHRRGERSPRAQTSRQAMLINWAEKSRQTGGSPFPLLETPGRQADRKTQQEPETVTFGDAVLTVIEEGRQHMSVAVDATEADRPVLVSFARQWFPGYRVFVDGEPAVLHRLDRVMPAVELPGGRLSRVELIYRPTSLIAGGVLIALTLASILFSAVLGRRRTAMK